MVGDGHTMSVAAQILQHIFGTTKGTFQVHHPVLSVEWPQPGSEDLGLGEKLQVSLEAEPSVLEGLLERVDKLAAKDFPQHLFGEKVIFPLAKPAGVIRREAAGGRGTMNLRMNFELLAPGMQHTEEADLRPKVSRIASHFEEGFRTDTKQKIVEDFLVLQDQWRQATGQSEHDMGVGRR